jgi:glycosyltransferase involved in cell wall biosynthesis
MVVLSQLGHLRDRIHQIGWVAHDELPALYRMASLYAFPSLYEGFGIPLLEAMACACPIVTANTCAPPEVTAGSARLVEPLSVPSIAEGMLEVLSDDSLAAQLRAAGVARAKDFGWNKCAGEVLQVFDRLGPMAAGRSRALDAMVSGSVPVSK